MDENAISVLHTRRQIAQGLANVLTRGLIVLQVSDVAGGHLHGLGHLCG